MSIIAQIGKVGINTTAPTAMLHVKDSSVLFTGADPLPLSPGNPPVSGAGNRMMWYPDKSAFRAGIVSNTSWDKDSIGNGSVAVGFNTKAKGALSMATGALTTASGPRSTAMGFVSKATNENAVAMGYSTTASGSISTAMGINTIASGNNSTAMGSNTVASGHTSIAMGAYTTGSGFNSTAMGRFTIASGDQATAIGFDTRASGPHSLSMGYYTLASGDQAVASGHSSKATGRITTAAGLSTKSKSYAGTVIGTYNDSTNAASETDIDPDNRLFQIGNGTSDTSRSNALTVLQNGKVGINTTTPTAMLHVQDSSVVFSATPQALSPGHPPVSGAGIRMMWYPDKSAFRAGRVTGTHWDKDSIGFFSMALGYNTKARANSSVAFGNATVATGNYSLATGAFTKASGTSSTAMGELTNASAWASTAIGLLTTASGNQATAMGYFAKATNSQSTSMGFATIASGEQSTALGYGSVASGNIALATGRFSTSKSYGGTVIGTYNDSTNAASSTLIDPLNRVFQIGNGTANNARSNAMTVLQNGNIGIGTTTPGFLLNFPSSLGDKISLWGSSGNHYGFGVQASLLQIHSETSSTDIAFGYGSSSSFTETMRIKGNGNVGIGITTPSLLLHVAKNTSYGIGGSYGIAATNATNPNKRLNLGYDSTIDAAIIQASEEGSTFDKPLLLNPNAGNVGIGSTSASTKLDVAGTTQTDGLQVSPFGTVFTRMEGGTTSLGPGIVGVNVYTINFPSAFSSTPKVIVTVHAENYNDTFSVTTKNVTSTSFQVNVVRTDSAGGWAQNLQLDWFAFE